MPEMYVIFALSFTGIFAFTWLVLALLENMPKMVKKAKLKRRPRISVIIPAYNEENNIAKTVKNIFSSGYPKKKLEVIVVDDGSTDGTYGAARRLGRSGVKVFRKPHGGKAAALNFGLGKASNELVITTDADTFLTKGSLDNIVKYMDNAKIMSVTPSVRVYKPAGALEKIQDVEYAMSNFIRKIMTFTRSLTIANASPLFRKSFLKRYGGFDEDNLTEDFEIGLRIQSKNCEVEHALDSIAYTKVPENFKKLAKQRIRWYYGFLYNSSKYKFMFGLKYGDLGLFFLPMVLVAFSMGIIALFYVIGQIASNLLDFFKVLSLVGFDLSYFTRMDALALLDSIFNVRSFLSVALLAVSITGLLLARKKSGAKISLFWYLMYIFFYGWLLIALQAVAVLYFLLGRKPKW